MLLFEGAALAIDSAKPRPLSEVVSAPVGCRSRVCMLAGWRVDIDVHPHVEGGPLRRKGGVCLHPEEGIYFPLGGCGGLEGGYFVCV